MAFAKITLMGNLGRDPETRYTPSGAMNVEFSMAVTRKWNDQGGQLKEETTWFRVTGWGKMAERLDKLSQGGYLTKGKPVVVTGSVSAREYTDKQGEKRFSVDVRADDIELVSSRQDGDNFNAAPARSQSATSDEETGSQEFDDVPF